MSTGPFQRSRASDREIRLGAASWAVLEHLSSTALNVAFQTILPIRQPARRHQPRLVDPAIDLDQTVARRSPAVPSHPRFPDGQYASPSHHGPLRRSSIVLRGGGHLFEVTMAKRASRPVRGLVSRVASLQPNPRMLPPNSNDLPSQANRPSTARQDRASACACVSDGARHSAGAV